MNNLERRDQQILYISDDAVFEEQKKCRAILQKLNFMDRADFAGISALVKELFGTSDGAFLNPPFYCDYGSHIHVGKNFFANYNCTTAPESTLKTIPKKMDICTKVWWKRRSHTLMTTQGRSLVAQIPVRKDPLISFRFRQKKEASRPLNKGFETSIYTLEAT